jgi:O-acetylserine/cysteine efflux transporter
VVNLGIKEGLSAGIASLVLQFSALLTILLGGVVFKDRITAYQWGGIGLALLGLLCVLFISNGTVTALGVVLVLCGAASWSAANVLMKLAKPQQVVSFLVWSSLFSPIPLALLALAVNGPSGFTDLPHQLDGKAIASILFQVYPNTIVGYSIWNWLLREYPIGTVAPLSLLVPVFGVAGSVLIFHDPVSALLVGSFVLIVAGLVVGLYGKRIIDGRRRAKDKVAIPA